jgi:murein DD-endopeptidase MepM/ murein hydrolase activator NlpD
MSTIYTVRPGDSLSKIAKAHGISTHDLVKANHIHNPEVIRIGKKLTMPEKKQAAPQAHTPSPKEPEHTSWMGTLALQFVDVLNKPIEMLSVAINVNGKETKHKTDGNGKIPDVEVDAKDTPIQVTVEKISGGWKKITEFTAWSEAMYVRLRSPKVMLHSEMRVHEGPTQTSKTQKPVPQPVGTVTVSRSPNGNPVQKVALECPNPENLRLGPNVKYRDIIIAAGKRSGFIPQAIAAIMNAEAATLVVKRQLPKIDKKTGKPVLGKDGKPTFKITKENTGEWDAKSASPLSSARGMTQFLDASWIDEALTNGTFLNARLNKEGWLTTTTIQVKKGKAVVDKVVPAFKLSNGTLVTATPKRSLARVLSSKPYITGRATASDANLQKILDLRFEPEYAIQTAVDYGVQNLKGLENAGFKVNSVNDGEKAKMIYLTHHLGLADAKAFINNVMTAEHAQYLLEQQIGSAKAKKMSVANSNDYLKTHRKWLAEFIDGKIKLTPRMCDPTKSEDVRGLIEITEAIHAK